jgi:hypothetical protein
VTCRRCLATWGQSSPQHPHSPPAGSPPGPSLPPPARTRKLPRQRPCQHRLRDCRDLLVLPLLRRPWPHLRPARLTVGPTNSSFCRDGVFNWRSGRFLAPSDCRLGRCSAGDRVRLLNNFWCGVCRTTASVDLRSGSVSRGDLVLRGYCTRCGSEIARLVEDVGRT